MPRNYVVTGAGPVGWTVAEQLAAQGHQVRVITRSGSGPEHPLVERITGDAKDPEILRRVLAGADAVFHCIHGSSYTAAAWEAELPAAEQAVLSAAQDADAVVVFPESLYSYSEPGRVMTEDSPRGAAGGKRGVRTKLLRAREASKAATVSVVAGDFFGPRVRIAHGGERIVKPILGGRSVSVVGSASQPHSFTYVPDLAAAMIAAAATPAAWNSVWHAPTGPAVTQRELAQAFARAASVPAPKVRALPGWVLRATGFFSTDMRELAETRYQFERPFVMDSARSEGVLGVRPTPLDTAAAATVEWWRRQG